jgi:hypothetical protein
MKPLVVLPASLLAFLLVAASVGQSARATPSGPGRPTVVLKFLDVQTAFGGSFSSNAAAKPGDRLWLHSEFYSWHGAERGPHLGHADAIGVFGTSGNLVITAVASFPGGTVSIVGVGGSGRVSAFAVVGGTGIYATARGEVTTRNLRGSDSRFSADTVRLWT